MRAIETLITAWIAEQERERVRLRIEPGDARDGLAAPHRERDRDTTLPGEPGVPPDR